MNLADLEIFATIARHPSLASAASELHLGASALSKAIKRLEASLQTPLFDRSAKQLRLNDAGTQLQQRALALLQHAAAARADVMGSKAPSICRVAAPAVLLWRYGPRFATQLRDRFQHVALRLMPMFEDQAALALERGEVDFAWVTGALVTQTPGRIQSFWQVDAISAITMQLMAAKSHPLLKRNAKGIVKTAQLLQHDFACPPRSLFCGIERGAHSDGWRDDALPRRIRYWVDDLHALIELVKSGVALAYLPDFSIEDPALKRLQVSDCPYQCQENIFQLWAPKFASGWQMQMAQWK